MKIINDMGSIRLVGQIFGLIPFYECVRGELRISIFGKYYTYIINTIFLLISLLVYLIVTKSGDEFNVFRNLRGADQSTEVLFSIISTVVIIVACASNTQRNCDIMREIGKLDELLLAKGFILHRYSCHILSTILALISFYMLGTACYYMQLLSSHFHYHQLVLLNIYGLQLFISNLYALCLRVLLGNIRQRIHLVNAKLELVAKSDLDVEHNWRQMSLFIELLCKFRFITDKVNTSNGIALFSYMSFAFYMLTNQSFMAFMTIVKPQGYEEKYDILGVSLAWIFVELVTILVICSACDDLSSEANRTSQILARVYGKGKEYQNIVDKFLSKSIKQDVQFTAYGFFAIDNTTLFKIFSAVTTYLVILIQFKQLEDSRIDN